MHRRPILLVALAAALAACAEAPTQRLSATAAPIRSVRVFAWGNGDPVLTTSARETLMVTLKRNGLKATQMIALQRPFEDLKALERAWATLPATESDSHALVLTRQYQQTGYVRYEAVLWDAAEQKLVWKGALASPASFRGGTNTVMPDDADNRAVRMAADLLRGLDRDGILPLHGKVPSDSYGHEIPPTLIPLQLL